MTETPTAAAASLADRLRTLPQYLIPQHLLSRLVYGFTRIRVGWVKNLQIRSFIRLFGIDMSDAEHEDPAAYTDFNSFFTRALRPGARPLSAGPSDIVCPVDGTVSQASSIEHDQIFQAKGHRYDIRSLLGGEPQRALPFRGGVFATLYLSPRDYHRIHMPLTGTLREMTYIPGRLFAVNAHTTRVVPGLFARNERVVTIFDTQAGPMAMVLVGAINVASIETVWAGAVTPPFGQTVRTWHYAQGDVELPRGAELGRFNMGSTVILLLPPGCAAWDQRLRPETPVRMGGKMGSVLK